MKRWMWTVAAVPVAAAAVWLLVPSQADITVITAIHPDGTVEWVDAELVPAEENHSYVKELPGPPHVSKLAANVEIRTAFGCAGSHGLDLTWYGMGAAECSREEFLALEHPPYAPELTFNWSGEISEIQGRYHP
ncbi:hypothetical protein [Lentzea aerocolonigenes]|uniref:hypothetical protein n=1 Tax=Lentzea aerocolonigenes TaxID=68170 RepID=UPI000AC5DD69|nr:hypothetical protein [Lentzea aerocolonigenes]MCP2244601.1 hypothetical protein [Lentzea aerocolonigenes]